MLAKLEKQTIGQVGEEFPHLSGGYALLEQSSEGVNYFSRALTQNVDHESLITKSKDCGTGQLMDKFDKCTKSLPSDKVINECRVNRDDP